MKLFSVFLLASLLSLTLGCKGGKGQQASTPTPTPVPVIDTDKDGIADATDPDDDNDGVADSLDRFPQDPTEMRDSDGDNQGDKADLDDDNDGLADTLDAYPLDPKEQKDSDNDGLGDNADADDDNDTIPDATDRFPLSNLEAADTDGDGLGNNADPDDDNDGVADAQDALPLNPQETSDSDKDGIGDKEDLDKDNDGVADSADKFPLDSKDAKDADADGIGDNADTDDDNDGTPDVADAQPFNPKEQTDTDGDGIGNHQDDDDDNDGVVDAKDKFPLDAKETLDYDSDGIGNSADTDDDNDGIADIDDKVLGLIKVSSTSIEDATKLKVARSGATAYVINSTNKTLASVEVATGATIKSITLSDSPKLIALSPDSSRIFVTTTSSVTTDFWTSSTHKLQAFAAADFAKIAEFNVGDPSGSLSSISNQQVILTPLNFPYGQLYDLTNGFQGYAIDSGGVNIFDAERGYLFSAYGNRLSKSVRSGNSYPVSNVNYGVSFAPDEQLWLNAAGSFLLSSTGQIFNTATLNKSNQLELVGAKITGVYVDSINALAYLALSTGSLAIVNADTYDLIQTQPVAATPLVGVSVVGQKLISLTRSETGVLSVISQAYDCPACYLNAAPKAAATADNAEPKTGQAVVFDATGTSDPDQDKLQYRWDFDGDGNWDTQLSATAKASFQYALPGTYSARLQVFDAKGASAQAVLAINVQVSTKTPIARFIASDTFDFPVTKGIFDGDDTVYYLDENAKRVYLVSIASGRAERYFQFDYPVKEIFNSSDLSNIYVVQHVGSQKIKTLISAIDTTKQVVESGVVLNEPYTRFIYVDAGHFLAAYDYPVLIDSKTGAISRLPSNNQFPWMLANEAGNIYVIDGSSASRIVLRGDELVVDKVISNNLNLGGFGSPFYVSRDENLLVGGTSVVPLKNPSDLSTLSSFAIKMVGDPKRNVVFAIMPSGSVEVINSSSGQLIQAIKVERPVKDVIVKDDQVYLMLELNTQQSMLKAFAHPCLSCKAGQTVAVNLTITPESSRAGKSVTFSMTSTVDTAINNWFFRWDLNGDGIWDGPFAPGNSVQTNFAVAGLKVVSGQARNEQGDLGSATKVFDVAQGESVAQTASNTSVAGRFGVQSIVAGVGPSGLFLVADQVTRKLYFYDVLLDQITKELHLEMLPEAIKISPDNSTAFIQLVDRQSTNFGGSNNERRYAIRVDIANYTATHSFGLPSSTSYLAVALNGERILTSSSSTGVTALLDAKTGTVLSSLAGVYLSGNRAVIDNRVYTGAGSYVDFSNDTLVYQAIAGTNFANSSATWALQGNKYVMDAEGRKLDVATLKIVSTQTPPWNSNFDQVTFVPQSNFGFIVNYSDIVFFNINSLEVVKRVYLSEIRSLFLLDGQLYSFGNPPSVRSLQSVCSECADNQAPLAKLTIPTGTLDTSMSIRLDASGSADPERSALSFRWDYNDDGVWDTNYSATSVQMKKFPVPGKMTVRVQIKDAGGNLADTRASFDVEQGVDPGVAVQSTRPFIFTDSPSAQVVDEVNGYLYYVALDRQRLYAMNLATGLVERYFQFETSPQNLAISPDNKLLYFTYADAINSGQNPDSVVASLDLASRTVIHSFKVKQSVRALAPLGAKRVAVANEYGSTISLYDAVAGQVLAEFPQTYSLYLRGTLDESTVLVLQGFNSRYAKYRYDEQSMMLLSEELPGGSIFNADLYWFSPDKTRVALNNGDIYNLADSAPIAKLPATNTFYLLTFVDNQSLVWVDYYNNGLLHSYNIATGVDTVGAACNCQALFSYAKQAWAIKRENSGIYYASKVP